MKKIITAILTAALLVCMAVPAFAAGRDSVSVTMDGLQFNKYGSDNIIKVTDNEKTKEVYFNVGTLPYIIKNNKTMTIRMNDGTLTIPAAAWDTPAYQQAIKTGQGITATLTVEFEALNDETSLFKYTANDGMVRADKSNFSVSLDLGAGGHHTTVTEFAVPVTYKIDYDFTGRGTSLTAANVAFYWIDKANAQATSNYTWTYLPGNNGMDKRQNNYTFQTTKCNGIFMGIAAKNHAGSDAGTETKPSMPDKNPGSIEGHWAKDGIQAMQQLGIVPESASSFYPDRQITRGEFAFYLVRTLGLTEDMTKLGQFSDVPATYDYYRQVYTAAASGIVKGSTATTFEPNAPISRQEMAVMMNRALLVKGKTPSTDQTAATAYGDYKKAAAWAKDGIAVAVNTGLISGRSATEFAPLGTTTRAEAVVILYRLQQGL